MLNQLFAFRFFWVSPLLTTQCCVSPGKKKAGLKPSPLDPPFRSRLSTRSLRRFGYFLNFRLWIQTRASVTKLSLALQPIKILSAASSDTFLTTLFFFCLGFLHNPSPPRRVQKVWKSGVPTQPRGWVLYGFIFYLFL